MIMVIIILKNESWYNDIAYSIILFRFVINKCLRIIPNITILVAKVKTIVHPIHNMCD